MQSISIFRYIVLLIVMKMCQIIKEHAPTTTTALSLFKQFLEGHFLKSITDHSTSV